MKLQIVGGGKMGEALLGGLLASGWAKPEDLGVIEPSHERRTELTETHSGVAVTDSVQPRVDAVIAVKPQHVVSVVDTLAEAHVSRLLSIAAGVTIGTIEARAPNSVVVRAMPNTPALVRAGASAIAGGSKSRFSIRSGLLCGSTRLISMLSPALVVPGPPMCSGYSKD